MCFSFVTCYVRVDVLAHDPYHITSAGLGAVPSEPFSLAKVGRGGGVGKIIPEIIAGQLDVSRYDGGAGSWGEPQFQVTLLLKTFLGRVRAHSVAVSHSTRKHVPRVRSQQGRARTQISPTL